jgi:hypothetical protein
MENIRYSAGEVGVGQEEGRGICPNNFHKDIAISK